MIIESPQPKDADAIVSVASSVNVFNSMELYVVRELLDAYFEPEQRDDHSFIIYRNGNPNSVAGFACFGPTPLTERVWDLYWICVDRAEQAHGIGKTLLKQVEDQVRARCGRAIYLETSDSEAYQPARNFYEHNGYCRVAHLPDFYAPGEGKIIYCKTLE